MSQPKCTTQLLDIDLVLNICHGYTLKVIAWYYRSQQMLTATLAINLRIETENGSKIMLRVPA